MDQKIWYYADGDKPVGVFSKQDLLHFRAMGRINGTTLIWCEGMKDWMPLEAQFSSAQNITDENPPLHVSTPDKTDPVSSETDDNEVGQKRTFLRLSGFALRMHSCSRAGRADQSIGGLFFFQYLQALLRVSLT